MSCCGKNRAGWTPAPAKSPAQASGKTTGTPVQKPQTPSNGVLKTPPSGAPATGWLYHWLRKGR